ncbi:MAG: hypothetical protein IPJ04_04285 [Candidatus Eisenbacteria bacterium]|nr:hypothetical protein [Candidatus Eisenbacteria bacterium]
MIGPPAMGRLEVGDELVALDGQSFTDPALRDSLKARGWPREALQLTVARRGEERTLDIPPVRLTAWERLRIYAYPIAAVVAAPIVAFLLVWRRPDLATAWVFLWFAALQGLSVVWGLYQFPQDVPGPTLRWALHVHEWLAWLYPASFVHFMSVFPRALEQRPPPRERLVLAHARRVRRARDPVGGLRPRRPSARRSRSTTPIRPSRSRSASSRCSSATAAAAPTGIRPRTSARSPCSRRSRCSRAPRSRCSRRARASCRCCRTPPRAS